MSKKKTLRAMERDIERAALGYLGATLLMALEKSFTKDRKITKAPAGKPGDYIPFEEIKK